MEIKETIHKLIGYRRFIEKMAMTIPGYIFDAEPFDLAISALEKQVQTKEAIPHRNYQYLSDYWCECGWHLGKKGDVKFCANCGRRIKWD